jgi:hypothetical protein
MTLFQVIHVHVGPSRDGSSTWSHVKEPRVKPFHPGLVRVDLRVIPHISKRNESYVKEKSGHEETNEPCSKRQGVFFSPNFMIF